MEEKKNTAVKYELVNRPIGEWIEYKNFNGELKTYECSNCKHPQGYKTPYCCECGAKMKGAE